MDERLAPIALFVYNRPAHTRLTIDALQKNELASLSDLYIFSDGPKNDDAKSDVDKVRALIGSVQGFKTITVIERECNNGLAESIIDGVTRLCDEFDQVIVLEDDLQTSPYFLSYMRDALKLYRNEDEVISIHAYSYPVKGQLPETYFLRGADCWGWATWKRGWDLFEPDGKKLLDQLSRSSQVSEFNFNNSYDYIRMLRSQVDGRNSSWAIRWYASAFLQKKLTLYSGRSLVQNIGNDSSGTHCGQTDLFSVNLAKTSVRVEHIPVKESVEARKLITAYFNKIKPTIYNRLRARIRRIFSRRLK